MEEAGLHGQPLQCGEIGRLDPLFKRVHVALNKNSEVCFILKIFSDKMHTNSFFFSNGKS